MRKVGKVINIEKDKVYIVTEDNEFCILKKNNIVPEMGKIYAGNVYKRISPIKKVLLISLLAICIIFVIESFLYFKTDSSLIIDMGSSFKVNINNLGIIIKVEGNNQSGRSLLKNKNLKYKSADYCLTTLLEDSIKANYVGTPASPKNEITIFVMEGQKKFSLRYSNFRNLAKNRNKIGRAHV